MKSFLTLLGFLTLTGLSRAEAPDWLQQAAKLPTPESAGKAPAVVLFDDYAIEVEAKGGYVEIHRRAIRILHHAGNEHATGSLNYLGTSDKIEYLGAWLVRQGKTFETKKKSDWVDLATNAAGAVVDESRASVVSLADKALQDDVFGYETKHHGNLLVAQFFWRFGAHLPVLGESVKLTLPPGFTLDAKPYGPLPIAANTQGNNTWTWSLGERPYRREEPLEHPTARFDAELFVRLIPPAGAAGFAPRTFASWSAVIDYYHTLRTGQCDTSTALGAKVRDLTADKPDNLAKIRALARHVQKLRYVAFNQGLRFGYGYKPRKASVVFSTGFGDCKDKANLLVAMLREVGIKAHPVGAYLGKERTIKPDQPTPAQTNHAIVAIEVSDEIKLPAVIVHEKYGRLLFFDATDSHTLLGDLSYLLQGTLVQVEIAGNEALTELPKFSAEADFRIDRRLDLVLTTEGAVQITGKVIAAGQTGAKMRAQFEQANMPKDQEELVTLQLNDKFRGAAVLEKKTEDEPVSGLCTLSFVCAQPKFIQWLQGQTGIIKLDLLSRKYLPNFAEKDRVLPIALPPLFINDEITLNIPAGFVATEFPTKNAFESPFGSCRITCEFEGDKLVFKRAVVLKETNVPVADYAKLRQFFSDIAKADRASVLIKPKT